MLLFGFLAVKSCRVIGICCRAEIGLWCCALLSLWIPNVLSQLWKPFKVKLVNQLLTEYLQSFYDCIVEVLGERRKLHFDP